MGVHHLNLARPPSPASSLSLPNRKTALWKSPTEGNGEAPVVLSQRGRSFTTKSALKLLKKSPRQDPCLFHDSGPDCHPIEAFSQKFPQKHLNDRNRYTLSKAAQKLVNASGHPKSPKNSKGPLINHDERRHSSESRGRDLARRVMRSSSKNASAKDERDFGIISSSIEDDRGKAPSREPGGVPQARGSGWWPYAAGGISLASAGAVAAHASTGGGGGSGQQPPSGGGGGSSGGSGGGDSGAFEAGSNGESFFGDLIYGPVGQSGEEKSSFPVAVISNRRRIPDNRLPARPLASLSSAAGDFMDGEGYIEGEERGHRGTGGMGERGERGERRERAERGERGRMPRRVDDAHHHVSHKQQRSYSAAKSPFSDGMRDPHSTRHNYHAADPFFSSDGRDGRAQDRPSISSPPAAFEGSRHGNAQEMNRGGMVDPFSMRGGNSGTGFDSAGIQFSSGGKQAPKQYHNHNSFAQSSDFDKAPLGAGDTFYNHGTTTSRDDPLHMPYEFSSIRGKISEIPGFFQEGGDGGQQSSKSLFQVPDVSNWLIGLGGFVKSVVGKRTEGEAASETEGQSGNDAGMKELVADIASRTLQMIKDQTAENGLAKSSETGALRRLQRETFADLLKIRDRLDKLEQHTGARRGKISGEASAGVKTSMKGEVNAGGAYVLLEDLTTNLSRFALQHAGLMTGLDVRFIFETPMRENDLLTTQCGVGQAPGDLDSSVLGGPISLQKINYVAQINDILSVAIAPVGARAHDMAETVNHLQGQALTTFAGSGPTMYQHCRGSAVGANLRSNSVMLSMSQFLSGWGHRAMDSITSGPLCLSTLAQIMVQPCEHMVFSMSAVNNLWPCPPLPSASGFHWSEMGPLVLSKTLTRPTQPTGTFTFNDLLPSSSTASFLSQVHVPERDRWGPDMDSSLGSTGTSAQSVAFSGEVDLGGHVSVGGWAQVDRADWLEELENKDFQWNLSLAKSSGPNVHWGLSLGRRKRDEWGEDGSVSPTSGSLDHSSSQLQMEAFVKLKVGRGFSVQPGLVYIVDKDIQTPAFMLRSSWNL